MRGCAGGAGAGRSPRGGRGGRSPLPPGSSGTARRWPKRSSTGQGEPKYPRGIYALPPGLGMLSQFSRTLPSARAPANGWWERTRSRHRSTWGRAVGSCSPMGPPHALPAPLVPNFVPLGLYSQPGWGRGGSSPAKLPDPRDHDHWAHPWGPPHKDKGWQRGKGTCSDPPNGTLAPSPCGPRPWRQLQG